MNIKEALSGLKKGILFFLDLEKPDLDDIEPMRQETAPKKVAPLVIPGERNSPRMRSRR